MTVSVSEGETEGEEQQQMRKKKQVKAPSPSSPPTTSFHTNKSKKSNLPKKTKKKKRTTRKNQYNGTVMKFLLFLVLIVVGMRIPVVVHQGMSNNENSLNKDTEMDKPSVSTSSLILSTNYKRNNGTNSPFVGLDIIKCGILDGTGLHPGTDPSTTSSSYYYNDCMQRLTELQSELDVETQQFDILLKSTRRRYKKQIKNHQQQQERRRRQEQQNQEGRERKFEIHFGQVKQVLQRASVLQPKFSAVRGLNFTTWMSTKDEDNNKSNDEVENNDTNQRRRQSDETNEQSLLLSSFADISIIGFPKAGTSHLYKLLISHPHAEPIFKRKEFCIDHGNFLDYTTATAAASTDLFANNSDIVDTITQQEKVDTATTTNKEEDSRILRLQKRLFNYHQHVLRKRIKLQQKKNNNTTQGNSDEIKVNHSPLPLLVNGCLKHEELDYHKAYIEIGVEGGRRQQLQQQHYQDNEQMSFPSLSSSKFIVLFRDPADWLWASWNYWYDKHLDTNRPVDHDWATAGIHYRSPELFHQIIISQGKMKTHGIKFNTMKESTIMIPKKLLYLVGKENILFLKSEDMTRKKKKKQQRGEKQQQRQQQVDGDGGDDADDDDDDDAVQILLQKLQYFTGLNATLFDPIVAYGKTNCNAKKGFQHLCDDDEDDKKNNDNKNENNNGDDNDDDQKKTMMVDRNINNTSHRGKKKKKKEDDDDDDNNGKNNYPITNYRSMLSRTRKWIYLQFYDECMTWSKEFNVVYQDCLNVI